MIAKLIRSKTASGLDHRIAVHQQQCIVRQYRFVQIIMPIGKQPQRLSRSVQKRHARRRSKNSRMRPRRGIRQDFCLRIQNR